jgi:folate-binding protein YgfZ
MTTDVTTTDLLATEVRSPLLGLPGAVDSTGIDAGTALHYGDPLREQRWLTEGAGLIDRSNRGVIVVTGVDRLSWLHSICSQHVANLKDGDSTRSLVLSPNGHVEQDWEFTEIGGQVWIDVEPGNTAEAIGYLNKMIFMKRVEPADVSLDWGVLTVAGPAAAAVLAAAGEPVPTTSGTAVARTRGLVRFRGEYHFDLIVPRSELVAAAENLIAAGAHPAGSWASDAVRVERRQPRLRFETDHRTIPHEIGLIGVAVHLNKGCYRGQETVARVHNLGKPPRRLVLLHLSGEREELPEVGTPVEFGGRSIGFLGTAVHHHELGPIGLAVIKRTTPDDAELTVADMAAAIDPGSASTS